MSKKHLIAAGTMLLVLVFGVRSQTRVIDFAGMSWSIRQTTGPSNPGPTTFSNAPDQIWIDSQGRLHL
ncbi:MAG: hypothetical protein N3A02_01285, partial [Rectinema sp.]|nr:hypothetical protein [Rectinema sp.]